MKPLASESRKLLATAIDRYASQIDLAKEWLGNRGIPIEVAKNYSLGLVTDPGPGHESARGRLAIPYFDATGPTTIRFRSLDNSEPKYWSMPGDKPRLYNVTALLKGDSVAVCEGELDALILDGCVGIPAVAIAGSGVWADHWIHCFVGFTRVDLFIDADSAGDKLARRLEQEIPGANRIHLPKDMDVNDTYLAYGSEWFWE